VAADFSVLASCRVVSVVARATALRADPHSASGHISARRLLLFRTVTLRAFCRGWLGEQKARIHLRVDLDPSLYRRIDNLIVPDENGHLTQIDQVVVSPFGIFVIETKNLRGWIFGSENQANWTQVFPTKKFKFQNPLHQNYRHAKCLAGFLRLDSSLLHSIAFFAGKCEFKTAMPANVITSGLGDYIKKFRARLLQDSAVTTIVKKLEDLKSDPEMTSRAHIASLQQRHGK
jgi:hypothetical protein